MDADQRDLRGLGPDVDDWLTQHGGHTKFRGWDELAAPLGRPVTQGGPDYGIVLAARE